MPADDSDTKTISNKAQEALPRRKKALALEELAFISFDLRLESS